MKAKALNELTGIIRHYRSVLEQKYRVKNIAIFGSYARGEQTDASDVDILVEFNNQSVGFLFIHLADFLEEILDAKVDLLTPDAIKPNRKEYITENLVYV